MIPTLILTIALQASGASDYFPLKPGTVRTYELKDKSNQLVSVVGVALDMGGVPVTPITERQNGVPGTTSYYRVDSDRVSIVAYDVKHPLTVAMPVLKIGVGKITWDYVGKTRTGPEGERLLARGESHSAGQREVLGKKVDVIEVKLLAQVGAGMSAMQYEQNAVYGRGFGLVELTTKMKLANSKKPDVVTYRLISVEEGKVGS